MLLGTVAFVIVVIALLAGYAIGGVLIALAWNFLVPLFWHAAPHLTWLHGVAFSFLLTCIKGLVTIYQKVEKK